MQEIWKPVVGYEEYYQISNKGRLKRIAFYHTNWKKEKQLLKRNKILKTSNEKGYEKIKLVADNKKRIAYIHRLVAEAFIPNPMNYKEVNHIDNNPSNNNVENLEWCDRKYNLQYMVKHQEQVRDRHERRIEALEMILYLAKTKPFVDSEQIKEIITEDLVGDY